MRDMTAGQPRQHLWRHALPLLLGNWMQLSYNAVDSIIAGRFIGKEALQQAIQPVCKKYSSRDRSMPWASRLLPPITL